MANPSATTAAVVRGLAIITGIVGGVPTNITAWANGILPQSSDITQEWVEELLQDARGFDAVVTLGHLEQVFFEREPFRGREGGEGGAEDERGEREAG